MMEKARGAGNGGTPEQTQPDALISAEERLEVLAEIEEAAAKARAPVPPEAFSYVAPRKGTFLPILVNIAAVVVMAAGALFFWYTFSKREDTLTGRGAGRMAGESAVVGTIRRESEEQVRSKDEQIRAIQGQLAEVSKAWETLKSGADAEVQKRGEELRAELDAELAAERDRLRREGASATEASQQIAAREAQGRAAAELELASLRRDKDAELSRARAELDARAADYQKGLEQAQRERGRMETELQSRNAAAASETDRLSKELAALRDQGRREQLALDQITAFYAKVADALKASRHEDALAALDSLAAYIQGPGVSSLAAVKRRAPVDLFLIGALRDGMQAGEKTAAEVDPQLAESAGLLREAGRLAAAADVMYRSGDRKAAAELYAGAIEQVPALRAAPGRLTEADRAARDAAADREALPLIDRADTLLARGSFADASAGYAAVLAARPSPAAARRAAAGIRASVDALTRKREADLAASGRQRDGEIARRDRDLAAARDRDQARAAAEDKARRSLDDRISAAAGKVPPSSTASAARTQDDLIALLRAKVLVKEALSGEEMRAKYADLGEKLDTYIDRYGEQKREEGSRAALQDIAAVVDYLSGKKSADDLAPVWNRYAGSRTQFLQLLDRLKGLAQ